MTSSQSGDHETARESGAKTRTRKKSPETMHVKLPQNRLIYIIVICFILMTGTMYFVKGMNYTKTDYSGSYLSENTVEKLDRTPFGENGKDALLIYDEAQADSVSSLVQFRRILQDMKAGYTVRELSETDFASLSEYHNVILDLQQISHLNDALPALEAYVRGGGNLLLWRPPVLKKAADGWTSLLGIRSAQSEPLRLKTFLPDPDFMIGGTENIPDDASVYGIDHPGTDGFPVWSSYKAMLGAELTPDCKVYATDPLSQVPVIWRKSEGYGTVVVCNYPDCAKVTRGVFSSAYTLLGDGCVYPVINASTYFLDDFPSPVARSSTVEELSGVQIKYQDFLANTWWPQIHALGQKHGLLYTGMLIETYDPASEGTIERSTETAGYDYYGRLLLNDRGEIGIHGYNHQPLCGPDFVYKENGYSTWKGHTQMQSSLSEVIGFTRMLYPGIRLSVYVPPSNILSQEGREMIAESFPVIRTISSTYLEGADQYTQEFGVADDGIIEAPRILSGEVQDGRNLFAACSELNFHYVNTHFIHPDDVMDPARSHGLEWPEMEKDLDDCMSYIENSAPDLRHLTASGLAGAVERCYWIRPEAEQTRDGMTIHLANHTDHEYLMIRLNNGRIPASVSGGKITPLNGTLYLLECDDAAVEVKFE